jgi:hypothetical protein
LRNCHNRQRLNWGIVDKSEWLQIPGDLRPVLKLDDLKFYQCPVSSISQKTWQILELVNETTNAECDILHLPYQGTILDQPIFYREAVKIVRNERNKHRQRKMDEMRQK